MFPFASLHSNAGARLRAEVNLLPLNLQPLNLHGRVGNELQGPSDANHANDVVDELVLHESGEFFVPGDGFSSWHGSWRGFY
jgi:hypothetical protein